MTEHNAFMAQVTEQWDKEDRTMTTDAQIEEAIATAQQVAKARRQGDESLAQLLTRKWQETLPLYATPERRWLQTTFDNAYREASQRNPELFR